MRIEITEAAATDLEAVYNFIGADNPRAAANVVRRILDAIEGIRDFPNSGRPGRVITTRELVINQTPFIAVYRVSSDCITVVRVIHGARRWP